MTKATIGAGQRRRITMERTFAAPMEDVWELWTTEGGDRVLGGGRKGSR